VGLNRGTAGTGNANIRKGTGGSQKVPPVDTRPTLAEAGIDKKLSSAAQAMRSLSVTDSDTRLRSSLRTVRSETSPTRLYVTRHGTFALRLGRGVC
jgi:hypothetical protein